jgi:hypothetical protein
MFYRELNQLREENPDLGDAIDRLDKYLSSLTGDARFSINASTVSAAIGLQRDKTIGLLMAAAGLGLLRLRYRVLCPDGHGVQQFDRLQDIPKEIYCGACDETRPVTPDDVEYFFELNERTAFTRIRRRAAR